MESATSDSAIRVKRGFIGGEVIHVNEDIIQTTIYY